MENIWLIQSVESQHRCPPASNKRLERPIPRAAATDGMLRKISDMSVPNLPISNYGPGLAERVTTV